MPQAGVQSELNVETSPVLPGMATKPHTWTWIWFIVSVLIVMGFHVRLFGHSVPPAGNFP